MKLTQLKLKQLIKEVIQEIGFGEGTPPEGEFYKKQEIFLEEDLPLDEESLEEVFSEKQRRWACAQMGKSAAERPKGLSKEEAEEMCKSKGIKSKTS